MPQSLNANTNFDSSKSHCAPEVSRKSHMTFDPTLLDLWQLSTEFRSGAVMASSTGPFPMMTPP